MTNFTVIAYLPQCVLLALGLMANLCLFLSLKRELLREGRKHVHAMEALAAGLKEIAAANETPVPAQAPPAPVGIDLNRRARAIQLWRDGQDPAQISGQLSIPRNEVEMLIRVQRLIAECASAPVPDPIQT